MARVTVEDCFDKIKNRFELVILAAQRGKELNYGASSLIKQDGKKKHKEAIVSLIEIEEGLLNIEQLKTIIINKYRSGNILDVETPNQEPSIEEVFQEQNEEGDDKDFIDSAKKTLTEKKLLTQLYQDEEDIIEDNNEEDHSDEDTIEEKEAIE